LKLNWRTLIFQLLIAALGIWMLLASFVFKQPSYQELSLDCVSRPL
jgi:hypothetical protein